jgi:uncharacterized protein YegL
MPSLASLEQKKLPTDNFGYSATRLRDLQATEYTLVTMVVDVTGSVSGFEKEMEGVIKAVVEACKYSPRADNLMLRLVTFNTTLSEEHGFKLLQECSPDQYDGVLKTGGCTALFDAATNGIEATNHYGKSLVKNDYAVNAIVIVLTDGEDNASALSQKDVKKALADAVKGENLESMVSILVGVRVTDSHVKDLLDQFHKDAGFTQYVVVADASAKKLARLAEFVSKSISSQSSALGSGGPSKSLTF